MKVTTTNSFDKSGTHYRASGSSELAQPFQGCGRSTLQSQGLLRQKYFGGQATLAFVAESLWDSRNVAPHRLSVKRLMRYVAVICGVLIGASAQAQPDAATLESTVGQTVQQTNSTAVNVEEPDAAKE